MPVKTYVPTLIVIAKLLHKYIGKYQAQLTAHLTDEQVALVDNLLVALGALINAVEITWGA